MPRFLVIVASAIMLLFSAFMGLIRLQPHDDGDLRAFLSPPDGCSAPCFLGIRPGITTTEQAMSILNAHEWITAPRAFASPDGRGIFSILASWSGLQPVLIDSGSDLHLWVTNNTILGVGIITRIPLGDIWLSLGTPDDRYSYTSEYRNGSVIAGYAMVYSEHNLSFSTQLACPGASLWQSETEILLSSDFSAWYGYWVNDSVPPQVTLICRALTSS